MPTSADFRNTHQILYRASIVPGRGWTASPRMLAGQPPVGERDVIDLDHNGEADTVWQNFVMAYREPVLGMPFSQIADHARKLGTEVLTQHEFSDLNIENFGVLVRPDEEWQAQTSNTRSISTWWRRRSPLSHRRSGPSM